jgi:hypothetical protein
MKSMHLTGVKWVKYKCDMVMYTMGNDDIVMLYTLCTCTTDIISLQDRQM